MNTVTVLLIIHGLLAVALLGAITHQAASVWMPARKTAGSAPSPAPTFTGRFRGVAGGAYTDAIIVLYVLTFLLGGIIYAEYRIEIRIAIEQLGYWAQSGSFELKEHFAALGLAMLPAYRYYWRQPAEAHGRTRALLTALLAFFVWWNFLVGHILNNVRGFGS